ncbi:uncharacterized protein B0I36DRAFT_320244, partial [Microdochium trichocladiopsis]
MKKLRLLSLYLRLSTQAIFVRFFFSLGMYVLTNQCSCLLVARVLNGLGAAGSSDGRVYRQRNYDWPPSSARRDVFLLNQAKPCNANHGKDTARTLRGQNKTPKPIDSACFCLAPPVPARSASPKQNCPKKR